MLIQTFGLFWRVDDVDWYPGSGGRAADGLPKSALLGRRGSRSPGLRVVDFWDQRGIYILYGNYGPHYVGLNSARGLGVRLKEHLRDDHADQWDRFSWFGFRNVLGRRNTSGLSELGRIGTVKTVTQRAMIRELEALLIHAMGLRNISKTRFPDAPEGEWKQVLRLERQVYVPRLVAGRSEVKRRARRADS
jgi:hypothetical protein